MWRSLPLRPGRTKNRGKSAVEEVIRLRKAVEILKSRVREFEDVIIDPSAAPHMVSHAEMELTAARSASRKCELTLQSREQALGVSHSAELGRLTNSPYIAARMNARALKHRLRDKLRARKFELDKIERSFRKQVNGKFYDIQYRFHLLMQICRSKDPLPYRGLNQAARAQYSAACARL